jgi:hypothetical protein
MKRLMLILLACSCLFGCSANETINPALELTEAQTEASTKPEVINHPSDDEYEDCECGDDVDAFADDFVPCGEYCDYDYPTENIYDFREGLAVIRKYNKDSEYSNEHGFVYGFIDEDMELVIPFVYEYAGGFSDGLANVSKKGERGFINKKTEVVIPISPLYDYAEGFHGGVAVVSKDNKYGAIDTTGKVTVPLIYDYIRISFDYDTGLAYFIKDDKLGYVHKSGNEVVPAIYDYSFHGCGSSSNQSAFSNGLAMVERNSKFGFIDETGKEVIPLIYDEAHSYSRFEEKIANVRKGDKWFSINKKGEIISD